MIMSAVTICQVSCQSGAGACHCRFVAGNIILGLIPVVGWIIMPIFSICIVALEIYGLINGFTGKMKKLPVIGTLRF